MARSRKRRPAARRTRPARAPLAARVTALEALVRDRPSPGRPDRLRARVLECEYLMVTPPGGRGARFDVRVCPPDGLRAELRDADGHVRAALLLCEGGQVVLAVSSADVESAASSVVWLEAFPSGEAGLRRIVGARRPPRTPDDAIQRALDELFGPLED